MTKNMLNTIGWFSVVLTLGYVSHGITGTTALTCSSLRVRTRPSSTLWYRGDHGNDNKDKDDDVSSSWTMKEDWAILDQLNKFTVGEGENVRTFWTQLAAATPILSSKTPQALWERCQELDHNHHHHNTNNNNDRTFGPSPPLLTNWRLEGNRAVGTLEDGRVVWMQYHVVGRLPGDLFSDATSPSLMALIPGGYLEAFGGRIYELGQPAREMTMKIHVPASTTKVPEAYKNIWQEDDKVEPKSEEHDTAMALWLLATTGTVSAMVASTILSACIGYGAGLGIMADETGPHHQIMEQHQVHYKLSPSYWTPSMEERKAHLEHKIRVEEGMAQSLSEQLHNDLQLQQQEHNQWSSSYAQVKNKIDKEGGLLQSISEQLQKDRADLQGLERLQFYEQQARAKNLLP